jgi:hypothetical protein
MGPAEAAGGGAAGAGVDEVGTEELGTEDVGTPPAVSGVASAEVTARVPCSAS